MVVISAIVILFMAHHTVFAENAHDCLELQQSGVHADGVYTIYPDGENGVDVYCDMQTDGGGWTVLLARSNDTFQGNRSWEVYKVGFGNAHGNYWIGNDNIHLLTTRQPCQVYFKLQAQNGTWYYAKYDNFSVDSEKEDYTLHFDAASYNGNAGQSLNGGEEHNLDGMKFSTYDRDNDRNPSDTCTDIFGHGGWWYNDCLVVLLTGTRDSPFDLYFFWYPGVMNIRTAYMMIRAMPSW